MRSSAVHIHHIALHVTCLERSISFYRDVLGMDVTEPVDLTSQSGGVSRLTGSLLGSTVKNLMKTFSPQTLIRMNSRIAFARAGEEDYTLLLIEQRHPEKGYIKSVEGNTVYGFGCMMNRERNLEDLAWDLEIAGASFQFGDPFGDGMIYTKEADHHLYVMDPDNRIIELVPGSISSSPFITGIHHITLCTDDVRKTREFYETKTPLITVSLPTRPSGVNDTLLGLGTEQDHPVIILFERRNPDMSVVLSGGHGLDHFALTPCTCTPGETGVTAALDIPMDPVHIMEKTKSRYFIDPDQHLLECIAGT